MTTAPQGIRRTVLPAVAAAVLVAAAVSSGATPAQAGTINLVFASWNVCKTDCAPPAPPWDVRRERVARVIAESGADVIGVQEATNNPTSTAKTQLEDVANIAAPAGYALPAYSLDSNECRRPRDAAGQLAGPSPCNNTAGLLFKTSSVAQMSFANGAPSAGIAQYGSIVPGSDAESASRSVMWAYLRPIAGSKPFLAISLHTINATTPEAEASRVGLGAALGNWVAAMNAQREIPGTPAILMADLNSYAKRQPQGAQFQLTQNGWVDAMSTKTLRNVNYSSINYNPKLGLAEQGFPAKPYKFKKTGQNPTGNATRIDYIYILGAGVKPLDYEVVIRLNKNGTFIPEYQGSDHQMIRTTLAFTQ